MRMRRDENMPISLKTQVECTAKTPIPACRARVGGLCRFRRPAERVPAGSPKAGHCTAVRAVSGIYEGVVERAKIAPVGS